MKTNQEEIDWKELSKHVNDTNEILKAIGRVPQEIQKQQKVSSTISLIFTIIGAAASIVAAVAAVIGLLQ